VQKKNQVQKKKNEKTTRTCYSLHIPLHSVASSTMRSVGMARHIFALSCRYSRRLLAPGLYIHDTMLRPGRKTVVASCYSVNDPLSSELRNFVRRDFGVNGWGQNLWAVNRSRHRHSHATALDFGFPTPSSWKAVIFLISPAT